MNPRIKIISVIGSGSQPYSELSAPLGEWIARQGFHLCNGGGQGVMQAVAESFSKVTGRQGKVIGILPSAQPCETPDERSSFRPSQGYPNAYVEIPIHTHLHLSGEEGQATASRNHIVVLTGDIVIALPGNAGTHSEIQLALDYKKPLVILQPNGEWKEFEIKAEMATTVQEATEKIMTLTKALP